MVILKENLIDIVDEVADLIDGYYADTNAQDGIPKLDMQWRFYTNLERAGDLVLITARQDTILLGIAMYMLGNHPQHGGMRTAICNTLAVGTKHRGKGIGGQLIEAAEAYFRNTEVKMMVHGFRMIYDVKPIFPKHGFELAEQMYMKVL